ncbi:hypothetical protein [Spirosoma rhododendri]|uniref:Uncharacterized protein n=1 Tax=Spirosoma rhododendri TaxID=2728024 RepID=A0A7L5DTL0_9BACT|nr:hypothetical protein [Spirosoma rhododendri]QJD80952.1 hypothetical protein HH216_22910 [Spirosoma rhododendri]
MDTYVVDIINPKALRLLEDLADMKLIDLKKTESPANQVPVNQLSDEEIALARERVMRGSPGIDLDGLLAHLRESRQDRKLPFRDEE